MEYDDAVAAFFTPSPAGVTPRPVADGSTARRLRDAIEPIAMHSVWSRTVNAALADEGLNFLTGYVWGRAALLGEPTSGTAAATFAVFEPAMVDAVLSEGRAACSRDRMVSVRDESTIRSLTDVLAGADVNEVATALRNAVGDVSGVGRPLFSGLRDQAWPDSAVGVLWRSCELLREHRGDGHVAVCTSRGLDAITMNILTELWVGMPLGSYTATRGWQPEAIESRAAKLRAAGWLNGDQLSAAGRQIRDDIEATTDDLQAEIVERLGADVDAVISALQDWSTRCVEAGAFPPDAYKRAAG
ncbi:MAG: hypothetical protein ABIP17_05600 [Ilumatobacteraceae bacterium]